MQKRKLKKKKNELRKCMWRAKRQSPKKDREDLRAQKRLGTALSQPIGLLWLCASLLLSPVATTAGAPARVSFDSVVGRSLPVPTRQSLLFGAPMGNGTALCHGLMLMDAAMQPKSFDGFALILAAAELAELAAESSKLLFAAATAELAFFGTSYSFSWSETSCWTKPELVSSEWWRLHLQRIWSQQINLQYGDIDGDTVNDKWNIFTASLDVLFRTGFKEAHDLGYVTDLELAKALTAPGRKGHVPRWKERTWPRAGPTGTGSMQLRKLRRRVAQLYELRRHLLRQHRSQLQEDEATRLLLRLNICGPLDRPGLLPSVPQALDDSKANLLRQQKEARQATLRQWVARMKEDPRALGRWLKNREKVPVRAVRGRSLCETPIEVLDEISHFWNQFWASNQNRDPEEISAMLLQSAHRPSIAATWDPPDVALLTQAFRKSGGSAGGDGFAGPELRHLPVEAITVFRQLALEWEERNEIPSSFAHSRMINFAKPNKAAQHAARQGNVGGLVGVPLMLRFSGVHLLLRACQSFATSLFWSMVLLTIFMLTGSLMVGNLLSVFILDDLQKFEDRVWIWRHFGTAYRSLYSFYEITFAGSWPAQTRPVLDKVSHFFSMIWVCYITIIVFALIRVITAIFLKDTLDAAHNDAELQIRNNLQMRQKYVTKLEDMFNAIDDGDGMITEEKLDTILANPKVRAYFQTLDLDVYESTALFRLLDDGDGEVTLDEFINGILRCKGTARAIDQVALHTEIRSLDKKLMKLLRLCEKIPGA
eukprot:s46_g54.t1